MHKKRKYVITYPEGETQTVDMNTSTFRGTLMAELQYIAHLAVHMYGRESAAGAKVRCVSRV